MKSELELTLFKAFTRSHRYKGVKRNVFERCYAAYFYKDIHYRIGVKELHSRFTPSKRGFYDTYFKLSF